MKELGFYKSIDVSKYDVFHGVGVYPIIILGRMGESTYEDVAINKIDDLKNNILTKDTFTFSYKTLKDKGIKVGSGTTGFQAKEVKQLIFENIKVTDKAIPFAVSGCVDPYLINTQKVTYLGDKYSNPKIVYDEKIIAESKWKFWCKEKIVIAGMTKRIGAVYVETPLALGDICYL